MPPIHFSVTVWIFAPLAAGRMLEHVGLHVRNGAAALDHLELLEQLLLLHRVGGRVDRARLLRRGRHCRRHDKCERQRAGDQAHMCKNFRHVTSPKIQASSVAKPAVRDVPRRRGCNQVAIDSR